MSTAGEPPPSLASSSVPGGDASSFLCRTCGCINFSSDDDCDKCRAAKQPTAAATRHPFLPVAAPHKRPSAARNGAAARLSHAATAPAKAAGRENGSNARLPLDAAPSGQQTATAASKSTASAHAAEMTAPSSARATADGRVDPPSRSATPPAVARPSTESSKRPHNGTAAAKKSLEVIDLISSDEESEDGQKRAAKRARHEARIKQSVARLALREVDGSSDSARGNATGTAADSSSGEHVLLREPPQGRCFDQVLFNPSDFPSQLEVSQALRQRHSTPSQTKTSSIAPPPDVKTIFTAQDSTSVAANPSVPAPNNTVLSKSSSSQPATDKTTQLQSAQPAISSDVPTLPSRTESANLSSSPLEPSAIDQDKKSTTTLKTTTTTVYSTTATTTAPTTVPVTKSLGETLTSTFPAPALTPTNPSRGVGSQTKAHPLQPTISQSTPPIASTSSRPPSPAVTKESAVGVPPRPISHLPVAQTPIIVDDSDEEISSNEHDRSLFQSRRFDSIVFNPRDFTTANDGLNLARRSTPVARVPTIPGVPPAEPTILLARKKANPTPAPATESKPSDTSTTITVHSPVIKKEVAPAVRIIKPMLGYCSADFLQFMRDCVDDDDFDDDEELARARLHETVDLTNTTDDSGDDDDDDDDDDYFEIIETRVDSSSHPSKPLTDASTNAFALNGPSTTTIATSKGSNDDKVSVAGSNVSATEIPVVKRKRAPRPKETCILCEEKGWIKSLVSCPDCKKYYHKRCAREYGDETKCWNCDLEGMIDDSELTEEHKNEVVNMFGALRQSHDSDTAEEGGDEEELEEKDDAAGGGEEKPTSLPVFDGKTTRSMRRWKEFLDVATAPVEKSFNDVTSVITKELQDNQRKTKYTRGFTTKESVEKAMAEVVDHYAELQDKEERLLREERARNVPEGEVAPDQPSGVAVLPSSDAIGTATSEAPIAGTATVTR